MIMTSLSRSLTRAFCLTLCAVIVACGGTDEAAEPGAATFVEGLPSLVPEPNVSIGEVSGEGPYLFGMVNDATRLSDGTIVVSDCQVSELRFFDAGGQHLRTVGGEGSGPGEFSWLKRLFPAGSDSVGTWDPHNQRVTLVAPDGGVRMVRVDRGGEVIGRLADGSFVGYRRGEAPAELGPFTYRRMIVTIDPSGSLIDSLPDLLGRSVVQAVFREGFPPQPHSYRLGGGPVIDVSPSAIFYGRQDDEGITEFGMSLEQVRVLQTHTRSEPVTESDKADWVALEESRELVAEGEVALGFMTEEFVTNKTAYGDVLATRDGWLWVQDPYRMRKYPLVWTAYEDGRPVAQTELPPRFFPFEFGRDWVLGITYDESRVEQVHVMDLVPGTLPGRALTPRGAKSAANFPGCGLWTGRPSLWAT